MTRFPVARALLALALLLPAPVGAQVRPHLEWRTVRTEHFDVHYPAELAEWMAEFAGRLEAVHAAVARLVGSAPGERVTVIAEDPYGQANGMAVSVVRGPVITVWPTPPDPRSVLGHNRGQAEQLAVHEFAHVAHLTRPTRDPRRRFRWGLFPLSRGPLGRSAPRWVREGYATYVEGRLTGSGRPHGVYRAAVLRQWALEGKLPTYAEMSASSAFQGGAMAYLMGSAYLEWLVERRGEESLVHLWRRLSARQPRTFAEAFAGVYGESPQDLYDRFTVEVTARALEARRLLAAPGLAEGDTVQRLAWGTGDPAVSPGGGEIAAVLRAPGGRDRVVVWQARPEEGDSAEAAARERLLARDPEDVPAVRFSPRPLRTLAALPPAGGRAYDTPRFLPDGERLLVTRLEPLGDGAFRTDLFVWNWKAGGVRRVTRGAGLRDPDPAPDGRSAAAVQCLAGACSVARVELASGAVATLARGGPDTVFYRPRWSPDGSWIVAAMQERGRWRLVRVDPAGGPVRAIDPDDGASRYDAAFLPGGRELVAVSERGGVANLEVLDTRSGAVRPLSRVTGAALAPAPDTAGGVYYLGLHARGLDLRRIATDSAGPAAVVALSASLAPVAPAAPAAVDTFPVAPLPPSRAYGIGPRTHRVLPLGAYSADGATAGAALLGSDPVGRLTWTLQAALGDADALRGASLRAVWRGRRPALGVEAFALAQRQRHDFSGTTVLLDADYRGAALFAEHARTDGALRRRMRAGVAAGAVDAADGEGARSLAWAEHGLSGGGRMLAGSLSLLGSAGRTVGKGWWRGVGTAAAAAGLGPLTLQAAATYGRTDAGIGSWERFDVGGAAPGLVDPAILSQRIVMPALPTGTLRGSEVLALRGSAAGRLLPVTPYVWAARTDGSGVGDDWHRVLGAERTLDFAAVPYLNLPNTRLLLGLAYSLDRPHRDELRGYFTVVYRP
ncbi:MAG TPA: hypothetical protein VF615_15705 [Longimicrobiaceae bacterium]|jgi:hypothetical protein